MPRGDGTLDGTIPMSATTSPVPAARRPGRSRDHDQRAEHRPAVDLADHAVADLRRHPGRAADRGAGRGAVLPDAQRARRPAAQSARATPTRPPECWPSAATRSSAWSATPTRCWRELQTQSSALDQIWANFSAVSQAAEGIHRRQPPTAATGAGQAQRRADHRRQPQGAVQEAVKLLNNYAMSLGESVSLRPVLQGLCGQPAARPVRAAVRRRGVLRPRPGSQRAAAVRSAPTRRPASRALPRCRCRSREPGRAASRA